jgi:hypothetical protein
VSRSASRRQDAQRTALLSKLRAATVTLPMVLAPLLLAGALLPGQIAIAAAFGLAAIGLGVWAYRAHRRVDLGVAGAAVVAAAVWTLVQALPWPRAVVEGVLPEAVANADEASVLVHEEPDSWLPPSVAPEATQRAALHGLAIASALLAGLLAAAMGGRAVVLRGAVVATVVAGIVSLAHVTSAAERVFGLYAPRHAASPVWGPILNPNHLAALLAFGVPIALGIALDVKREERGPWLVGALFLGATAIVTLSRSGIASLAGGVGLFAVAAFAQRRRLAEQAWSAAIAAGITVLVAVGLGLYAALDRWLTLLPRESFDKIRTIGRALEFALGAPALGYGRGAFSAAFVAEHGSNVRFEHPENFLAQWATEWGVIPALALLVALAVAWSRALRGARSFAQLGALAAVAALALHDLVDFAGEMPGIATVASATFGAALLPTVRTERGQTGPLAIVVGATSVLLALVFVPRAGASATFEAHDDALRELLAAGHWDAARQRADRAMLEHPAEPAFALLGAYASAADGRSDTGAWLNAAMRRAPAWHAPHLVAARWLLARGARGQALLEMREAETRRPGSSGALVCELVNGGMPAAEIARAAPAESRERFLDRAAQCVGWASDAAIELDELLASSRLAGPHLRRARRALAAGDTETAAIELARAQEIDRTAEEPWLTYADLVSERDGAAAVIPVLESAISAAGPSTRLLEALAKAHADVGDLQSMRATVARLQSESDGSIRSQGRSLVFLSRLEQQLGNRAESYRALEEAELIDPRSGGLALLAREAERHGDRHRAIAAHREICARDASSPSCAAADRLRATDLRPTLPPP